MDLCDINKLNSGRGAENKILVMVITSKESGLENRGARESERAGKGLNELCFIPEVSWIRPAQAYFVDRQTDR